MPGIPASAPAAAEGPITIGIVANEPSGDILGAGLMAAFRRQQPGTRFIGVGGPRMEAAGLHSRVPLERLSVMGLVEVLKHLPELLRIRRELTAYFLANPPDLFIGIDAPDFNLGLEARLKRGGIATFHYVSPTVWAWRQGRVKKIRKAVDGLLCLFPFEADFLRRHGVEGYFIGHHLADEIPLETDPGPARDALGLDRNRPVLALLPGSRRSELGQLADDFILTGARCAEAIPGLQLVAPMANERLTGLFQARLAAVAPGLSVVMAGGGARQALSAADLVLTASGTASLEALLLKKPQVVAYRLHPWTYRIVRGLKLVKTPFFSIANLLAGREIAPERLQDQVNPQELSRTLLGLWQDRSGWRAYGERALEIHRELRQDASATAARLLLEKIRERRP